MVDEKFELGDVVELKSGRLKMTFTELGTYVSGELYVHCSWPVRDKQDGGTLNPATLKKAERQSGGVAPAIGAED